MRHKKVVLIIICGLSLLSYHIYVWWRQYNLAMQLNIELQDFKVQQLIMLQSLSQQLLPAIKSNDLVKVSTILRNYEDLAFIFAKSHTTVPINIYFVSLTAPGILVGGTGELDVQMLCADEEYYLQTINNPNELNFAKTYTNAMMPEYVMTHWGMGVVDDGIYYGQLDVKASINAINSYLQHKITLDPLFAYKIIAQKELTTSLSLNWQLYVSLFLLWLLLNIVVIGGGVIIYQRWRKLYTDFINLQNDIELLQAQHDYLTQRIEKNKLATAVQHTYALLLESKNHNKEQNIKLQQLLQDVVLVNYEFALVNGVQLKLQEFNSNYNFYANQTRLMQILSGIVYELINELSSGSVLQVQYALNNVAPGIQKINFKFIDNGFYNQLFDREVINTRADIRLKGWQNIRALIDLEEGVLEHEHVVYAGNTLIFSIIRKVANNVVSLEQLTR